MIEVICCNCGAVNDVDYPDNESLVCETCYSILEVYETDDGIYLTEEM